MATDAEGQRQPSKRERAFLGQLPDDFLRVSDPPRSSNTSASGTREQARLVPLTYSSQPVVHGNYVGRLKVTVAQAKLVKNYGLTRMDPFCRIRVGHSVYETPTDINGSKNPRWNKTFYCNLPHGVNSLYVEVFNERYLSLDDRIAWGYYEFPEDLFSGETVEEWIPLTGKQGNEKEGNVNLILSIQPLPATHSYQLSAYGNQPVTMNPQGMPGAQMFYHGGYPPGYGPAPTHYAPPPGQYGGYPQQPMQQQPPSVSVPPVKEEDVKRMQEMFPSIEADVIKSVLEAARGNQDQAVNNLLSMTAD